MAIAIFQKHNHIIKFIENFNKSSSSEQKRLNLSNINKIIDNPSSLGSIYSRIANYSGNLVHTHLNNTVNHDNLKKHFGIYKPTYNRGQVYSLFVIFVLIEEIVNFKNISFKNFLDFYKCFNIDLGSRLSKKYFQEICNEDLVVSKSSAFAVKEFNQYNLEEIRKTIKYAANHVESNQENLKNINDHLNPDAKSYFENMFEVKYVKLKSNQSNGKYFICGDIDGSLPRMILFCLTTNHVSFKSQLGWQCLLLLLELECMYVQRGDNIGFQKDTNITELLELIMKEICFVRNENTAIFIGDILHDRLSNNKDLVREFIQKAHAVGIIFIKGNHDERASLPDNKEYMNRMIMAQWGLFCQVDSYDKKQWQEFENKYFQIAYYDGAIFCVHNGIKISKNGEGLNFKAFCGEINLSEIDSFEKDGLILEKLKNKLNEKIHLNDDEIKSFTNFRPKDNDVIKNIHPYDPFVLNKVTLIHGHDENFNYEYYEQYPIINVNARRDNRLQPACLLLF